MSKETFRHDRGTRVALVKSRWLNSMHLGAKMASVAYNLLWQLSIGIPRGAAYVALRDSQSTHARHAERAGSLRGALSEAGKLDCCR